MRLHSPMLAILGLLALGAVAGQLLTGALSVPQAALRVVATVVVLVLADRLAVPLARALVGAPSRPAPPADPGPGSPG